MSIVPKIQRSRTQVSLALLTLVSCSGERASDSAHETGVTATASSTVPTAEASTVPTTSTFPEGTDLGLPTTEGDSGGLTSGASGEPACSQGEYRCVSDALEICTLEGTWTPHETCDPLLGLTCEPAGFCAGPCAFLGASYIGCDYYIVNTIQKSSVFIDADFAVTATNAGDRDAMVTITYTYDDDVIDERVIGPNSTAVIALPAISALTSPPSTAIVRGGAFRLRATAPVTVYQYNPLQIASSNDASLLLPTNAWTGHYRIVSRQDWVSGGVGMFAVVAREDGTTVTIVPPGEGALTNPGAGIDDLGHGAVLLDQGDVLQVLTRWIWDGDVEMPGDLTGAQVLADKPVQVIAGHECTAVPSNSFACDHLEESMLPFEALGREYVVVPPVQWPETALPKAVFVRVVAAEDGTTLTFEPDQAVPKFLTKQGDFIEIGPTTEAFIVASDRKIVVAEYMVSHEFGYGTSDPSMVLAVPREQLRSEYIVYAHPTWLANFADIVAPLGSAIDVDGEPVLTLEPIGASGLGFAHMELSNSGDGAHHAIGDEPFGISVYGVGEYGSYWYPGGLDLGVIPPE